jgi:hypothetical protein
MKRIYLIILFVVIIVFAAVFNKSSFESFVDKKDNVMGRECNRRKPCPSGYSCNIFKRKCAKILKIGETGCFKDNYACEDNIAECRGL